jgi:predicted lipoprotein
MTLPARRSAVLAFALGLASCVPWTVKPIEKTKDSSEAAALNPAAYVDSIWSSKLLPAVANGAVDARVLLDALSTSFADARTRYCRGESGGPCYFLVQGEGVVTAVDMRSRMGLALVDVAPYDGKPEVSIQIGPVLRGSSLRDATGIVRFSDFVNQLQFADAGNAFNDRILKTVISGVRMDALQGTTVSFAGAVTAAEKAEPPLAELMPVKLPIKARP